MDFTQYLISQHSLTGAFTRLTFFVEKYINGDSNDDPHFCNLFNAVETLIFYKCFEIAETVVKAWNVEATTSIVDDFIKEELLQAIKFIKDK
jgi:hypothetical protein